KSDRDDSQNADHRLASLSKLTKFLRKNAPPLNAATIKAFWSVNAVPTSFRSSFHLPARYQLVPQTEIDAIFKDRGWWPDYYKKYPGSRGWLVLSRVGFSPDGKEGLFYVVNTCGDLCGGGA